MSTENLYLIKNNSQRPRQDGYTGNTVWTVWHPGYGEIEVVARDRQGAIVTAAGAWCEKWQRYKFYAYCEVGRRGKRGKSV